MEHNSEHTTALITGGTSGIGKETARKLTEYSMDVVITGRDTGKGEKVAKELAGGSSQVVFVQGDVSEEADVRRMFSQAESTFGGVDLLFNNAGQEGAMAPVTDYPADMCDGLAATNIKGTLLCIKHAVPMMIANGGGTIINNASFVGTTVPFPGGMMYGATKAAVLSITSTLHAGYGEEGIRAFAICPWMTETPMVDRLTGGSDEMRGQLQQVNPSGSFASPADIARVVADMYSGKNPYKSGEAFLVDSGSEVTRVQIPYPVAEEA